ncbi:MAG: ATP-binding cassette domain-containing protein, partial [Polyangiales bacterium]
MSLIETRDLSLTLGSKTLFEGLNLRLALGDKLALVGPNGCGKSSLLRLIAGEHEADGGQLVRSRGMRLAYLRQELSPPNAATLRQAVLAYAPGREALKTELGEAEATMEALVQRADADADALTEQGLWVGELHTRLADFEQDYGAHKAERILLGLGFAQSAFDKPLSTFSGG